MADGQVIIIGRNKAQLEDGPTNINTQKPTRGERQIAERMTDGKKREMLFPVCWIASWRTDRKWICLRNL